MTPRLSSMLLLLCMLAGCADDTQRRLDDTRRVLQGYNEGAVTSLLPVVTARSIRTPILTRVHLIEKETTAILLVEWLAENPTADSVRLRSPDNCYYLILPIDGKQKEMVEVDASASVLYRCVWAYEKTGKEWRSLMKLFAAIAPADCWGELLREGAPASAVVALRRFRPPAGTGPASKPSDGRSH